MCIIGDRFASHNESMARKRAKSTCTADGNFSTPFFPTKPNAAGAGAARPVTGGSVTKPAPAPLAAAGGRPGTAAGAAAAGKGTPTMASSTAAGRSAGFAAWNPLDPEWDFVDTTHQVRVGMAWAF